MNAHKPPQPSSSVQAPGMSGEDMLKVFELLKGATSVELKLTVPDRSRRAAVKGPRLRPGRGGTAPGIFLRHARPRLEQGRRGGPRPKDSGRRWGYGGEAAPG